MHTSRDLARDLARSPRIDSTSTSEPKARWFTRVVFVADAAAAEPHASRAPDEHACVPRRSWGTRAQRSRRLRIARE